MKVYVKDTFPGNGRFHVTFDPDVSAEDVRRMKNAAQRKKARFARRKDVADLAEGEEILGAIVRVRIFFFCSSALPTIQAISRRNTYLVLLFV